MPISEDLRDAIDPIELQTFKLEHFEPVAAEYLRHRFDVGIDLLVERVEKLHQAMPLSEFTWRDLSKLAATSEGIDRLDGDTHERAGPRRAAGQAAPWRVGRVAARRGATRRARAPQALRGGARVRRRAVRKLCGLEPEVTATCLDTLAERGGIEPVPGHDGLYRIPEASARSTTSAGGRHAGNGRPGRAASRVARRS